MKRILPGLCAFVVLISGGRAEPVPPAKGAPLPPHSQSLNDVLVPVPREIFRALDRFPDSNWRAVQRSEIARMRPRVDPTENALLLGVVIAEGFIAVDAKDAAEVKSVGNAVLRFARALGVERAPLRRSRSIIEHAEKEDWPAVRKEWDNLLPDVEQGMNELKSEQLAQLVSLGGWLRGASALSALVLQNYTTKQAELLRQTALLDYFERRLAEMSEEIRANPNVAALRAGLPKLRQLLNSDEAEVSKETAQKIAALSDGLLKDLSRKNRGG